MTVVSLGLLVGFLAEKAAAIPSTLAGFWEPISYAGLLCPSLIQGVEHSPTSTFIPSFIDTHFRPAPF